MTTNKTCQCCGFSTLPLGSVYEICALCGWQDDLVQNNDPSYAGGANELSLRDYRERWESEHHRSVRVA